MPILADNFNRVIVLLGRNRTRPYDIVALRDDTEVGRVPSVPGAGLSGHYDPLAAEFVFVRDRIIAGEATHEYIYGRLTFANADALPAWFKFILEYDPLRQAIAEERQVDPDLGPTDKAFFRYAVIPADNLPLGTPFPAFDGSLSSLITSMEGLGWYPSISEAHSNRPADSVLYACVVSYFYNGQADESTLSVSPPETDAVQYIVEGVSTAVVPEDTSTIEMIQINLGGRWIDFPFRPPVERVAGVVTLAEIFPNYSGHPEFTNISADDIQEIESIKIAAHRTEGWGALNRIPRIGGVSIAHPLNRLALLYPGDLGWDVHDEFDDITFGSRGIYALAVHKSSGRVELGHTDQEDLASYYSGGTYWSFLIGFEGYPLTVLAQAVAADATTFNIFGSSFGLTVGDVVFVNDEEMRLDSIGTEVVITGTMNTISGLAAELQTPLTVTRGINGTTAALHPLQGGTVRAIVNADRIRRLTILKQSGLNRPFHVVVLGVKTRQEVQNV